MKIQTTGQFLGKKTLKKIEKQRNSKKDIFVGLSNHTKKEEQKLKKEIEALRIKFQDDPELLKRFNKEMKKFEKVKNPVTYAAKFFR